MSEDSREGYYHKAKQEGDNTTNKFSKVPSSRQWPGFRNPRIVRVSRSFGGKDRHSKVCTIRGLRDRRIRLSVPTAIQLYELQDRLGLSQPSKVIDWLLEVTKHDIDKLPPLQIPHGFPQFHHPHPQTLLHHHHHEPAISLLHPSLDLGSVFEKGKWVKSSEEGNEGNNSNAFVGEIPFQKNFPSGVHQYYNGMPCNYNNNNPYQLEQVPASLLSLSQFGSHGLVIPSHQIDFANSTQTNTSGGNGLPFSSSSLPPAASGFGKLLFCPSSSSSSAAAASAAIVPSFFAPHQIATSSSVEENDPRGQFNNNNHNVHHHQLLMLSTSHNVPFSSKLLGSSDDHNQPNKGSSNL